MSPSHPVLASTLYIQSQSHLTLPTNPPTSLKSGTLIGILEPSITFTPSSNPSNPTTSPVFPFLTRLITGYLLVTTKTEQVEPESEPSRDSNADPEAETTVSTEGKVVLLLPPIDSLPLSHPLHPRTLASALCLSSASCSSPPSAAPTSELLARITLHQYLSLSGLMDCLSDLNNPISTHPQTQPKPQPFTPSTLIILSALQPLLEGLKQREGRTRAAAALEAVWTGMREAVGEGWGWGVIQLDCEDLEGEESSDEDDKDFQGDLEEGGERWGEERERGMDRDKEGDTVGLGVKAGLDSVLRIHADSGEGKWV